MKTDSYHWLNTPERMLLALLRAALNGCAAEPSVFCGATDAHWTACYRLAVSQGVKCLAWDGVLTLPAELRPFEDLRLTWLVKVDRYEQHYAHYCRTIQELSLLYASHGIRTVQIKGVGLSSYYPVPSHREGGDLDIFTSSADAARLTDEQANDLADELMRRQGIEVTMHSYKHSNFYYRGVPVENHKCFLNVKRYKVAVQLDDLLQPAYVLKKRSCRMASAASSSPRRSSTRCLWRSTACSIMVVVCPCTTCATGQSFSISTACICPTN